MKKHINRKSNLILLILAAVFLTGCGKEKSDSDYIARVDDAYLTEADIKGEVDSTFNDKFKNEIIRNWVNTELLYKAAQEEGIVNKQEFKKTLEESKKELAVSFLLNDFFANTEINFQQADLENYFEEHKDEFRLFGEAYYLNYIEFNDENKAVHFRNTVLETNWNKALFTFRGDSSIVKEQTNDFLKEHEFHPVFLLRIVKELYPQELSIVLSNEENNFVVVQLLEKYSAGSIPSFEIVKGTVEKRYIKSRKEEELKNYINELYSEHNIEIKK